MGASSTWETCSGSEHWHRGPEEMELGWEQIRGGQKGYSSPRAPGTWDLGPASAPDAHFLLSG